MLLGSFKMLYLCKKILGENNAIMGYEVVCKTTSKSRPRGNLHEVIEGPDLEHPKVEQKEKGQWQIIQDAEKKTREELNKEIRATREYFLKNSVQYIDQINDLDQLKVILKSLITHLFH